MKSKKMKRPHMRKRIQKIIAASRKQKLLGPAIFVLVFACIGIISILASQAAPGVCSTTAVIGSATTTINAPETAQYRVWVRVKVPDTSNTGNKNGVRLELNGVSNQCFTLTTTNTSAVNQWMWINSDALTPTTPHITTSLTAGNYTAKILGLKVGVKVDKVILLKSDNTCTPDNVISGARQPGDNCTTPAPTVNITANPTSVVSGSATSLTWSSTNANSCTASGGWAGTRPTSGTISTANLTTNTLYTISCTGVGGSSSRNVTVTVTTPPVPTVTITALPMSINSGSNSILSWSSTNATSCTASGGWSGSVPTSGDRSTGNLTSTRTYNLSCTGAGGTANNSVTVTVTTTPSNDTTGPTVVMSLPGVTIPSGQVTTVVKAMRSVNWQPLASDASGIKSLAITVNGQPVSLTSGTYVFGSSSTQGNGDYTLRTVATDNFDNVTTSTLTVRLRHPDINRDGTVNSRDMTPVILRWGKVLRGETVSSQEMAVYDLNLSGSLNSSDITPILIEWGKYLRGEI